MNPCVFIPEIWQAYISQVYIVYNSTLLVTTATILIVNTIILKVIFVGVKVISCHQNV